MRTNATQKRIQPHQMGNPTCERENGLSPRQAEMVRAGSLRNTIREN